MWISSVSFYNLETVFPIPLSRLSIPFFSSGLDLTIQWSLASDDTAVNAAVNTLLSQSIALAKSKGLYNNYLYMNYALQSQDPIASYGPVNKANLEVVSRVYDPKQVFQKLVPGGFKLDR